jgi:hypothetical protein
MHNMHLLRRTLPAHLVRPSPIHTDREAYHLRLAVGLRAERGDKRAEAARKGQVTRAANKAKRDALLALGQPQVA